MAHRLRSMLQRWPQALLPSSCALCGARCGGAVCAPCHAQFVSPAPRCPRCANPVGALDVACACAACLLAPPAFDATLAGAAYLAPLDQLVLQLKFASALALAPWFAAVVRDSVLAQPGFVLPDVLCPVPLGPRRLVERGFNQALEIARPLARHLGIPLRARLALRARDTRAQSGVAPDQRGRNMASAFIVAGDAQAVELVCGRHIGLVDDVMTSGHTLGALAAAFKHAGAARVSNFVFARTPPR